MKTLTKILGIGLISLASLAEEARFTKFSYNPVTKTAKVQAVIPTNTTYKVEYKDSLTSTNDWKAYANILREGTNNVTLYSPSDSRFFRLRKR